MLTVTKRVARATGDNFNIFSVLGIEHYEETTHSRFIAELLNPNGCHGKGVLFLEEFLEKIQMPEHLDLETTKVKTEHNIGLKVISGIESTGGSIDIYLYDGFGKSISIENKIYASDQEKQIVRYHNHNKGKNIVLYLTLFEDDTDEFSKGELKSNKDTENKADFYCISYEININNWLMECQKIAVDNPTLRETIKQYRNLVKKLTNQNINNEMNEEILNLIIKNKKETNIIINTINSLQNRVKHKYENIVGKLIKMDIKELSNAISISKQKQGKFLRWENHYHYSFNLSSDNQDHNVGIFKYDNDSNIYFTTCIDGQEKKSFAHDTSEDEIYKAFLVFLKEAISIMEKKDL